MGNLSITRHWESAAHDVPEVRLTSANLKIVLGGEVITRNEDEWSQTVRDDVRLSAYPLALWFASSWWRLRWEPLPVSPPDSTWRMAHEVAAAGYGYLWPRMLLASDGESVHVWAVQSHPATKEPVRYLSSAYDSLTGREFERTIDDFVSSVLSRLDAVGVRDTDLHGLWKELLDERADKSLSVYRRIEAVLGFDPDDAPADAIDCFEGLIPAVGESAVVEIAPICAVKNPRAELERIVAFVESAGLNGHIDLAVPHRGKSHVPVWQTGRELARAARDALKLNGGPVNDARLSELVDCNS